MRLTDEQTKAVNRLRMHPDFEILMTALVDYNTLMVNSYVAAPTTELSVHQGRAQAVGSIVTALRGTP